MNNNTNKNFGQFFSEKPRAKKRLFGLIDHNRKMPLGGSYESHGDGNSGQTEDSEEDFLTFYDCGHPGHNEPGGKCQKCGAIICKECSRRCACCGIPQLCPQDVCTVDDIEVCHSCAEELLWSKGVSKFWTAILSPFKKSTNKHTGKCETDERKA